MCENPPMSARRKNLALFVLAITAVSAILWYTQEHARTDDVPVRVDPATDVRPIDLSEIPLVSSVSRREEAPEGFSLNIEYPTIALATHPELASQANDVIARAVKDEIAAFAKDVEGLPERTKDDPEAGPRSSFTLRSTMLLVSPTIISVRFDSSGYVTGAAHPNNRSSVLNYSLIDHVALRTPELFAAPADALAFLSEATRAKLRTILGALSDEEFRDFVHPGTEPTMENFAHVGITPTGLVVVFSPYQVAPGAMGAIEVALHNAEYGIRFAEPVRHAMTLAVENIELAAPEAAE